jgi:hypothetical protein
MARRCLNHLLAALAGCELFDTRVGPMSPLFKELLSFGIRARLFPNQVALELSLSGKLDIPSGGDGLPGEDRDLFSVPSLLRFDRE